MRKFSTQLPRLLPAAVLCFWVSALTAQAQTAPSITQQPTNQTVATGSSVNLSVAVSGTAPFAYQWQFDGTNLANGTGISGAQGNPLTITNFLASDQGTYRVIVTNAFGSATSSAATLSLGQPPPSITAEPQNLGFTNGNEACFRVSATGAPPLAYQWIFDGTPLLGATNSSLCFQAEAATNIGSYVVLITNPYGSVTSSVVTMSSSQPGQSPSITIEPQNLGFTNGNTASFSVSASGTPPLGFQWFFDGTALPGDTTGTLFIQSEASTNVGSYWVVVTNAYGSATSSVVTMSSSQAGQPPSITTEPQNLGFTNGNTGSFSVSASGTSPLAYQWFFDGAALSGDTTATLFIRGEASTNLGSYWVIVTNAYGSATSSVVALIGQAPSITAEPQNLGFTNGNTGSFSVSATGTSPLSYQWFFDGAALPGGTAASWLIQSEASTNLGSYWVIVTNAYGTVTSAVALLSVIAAPPKLIDVAFTTNFALGKTGFAATGVTSNDYWNTYDPNLSGPYNLDFADGTYADAGLVVANVAGANTNGATDPMYGIYLYAPAMNITVAVTNLITGSYNLYLYGHGASNDQNSVFQITVGAQSYGSEATTNGPGWLSPVWQEGVQYVEFTNVNVLGGQAITITVEPGAGGLAVLSGLQIAALPSEMPFIISQPTNQSAVPGATAVLSVGAGGTPPFLYQWLFNSAAIPAATNGSYIVTNVQPANAGSYSVVVTNAYGSVTSAVATLTIVYSVSAEEEIVITNTASGSNGPVQFLLGSGAPAGARVSTNGIFSWTPACAQGSTTNLITIWAVNNTSPPASNSTTLVVVVGDCVQVSIGNGVVQIVQTVSAAVPINLLSTVALTNLSFALAYPSGYLTSWTLAVSNSLIGPPSILPLNPSETQFNLRANGGQQLEGSSLIGSLGFYVLAGPSAFVPLTATAILATRSDGSLFTNGIGQPGRVVVIGTQPLLEAWRTNNSAPVLTLYGNPLATYQISSATNITGTVVWTPFTNVTLTNLFEFISPPATTNRMEFFRAMQQ